MEILKKFENAVHMADISADAQKLEQLSAEVHKVMDHHGFTSLHCHTECRIEIVIGPRGRPEARLVCRLICPPQH